ncbi:MAG: dihydroorotate dehydrogenase-like protein [Chloroflexi bacterium]|nr:dihydroorotate dehydrogenase-like protein [Chloroflexota bacterium]
MDLTTTYLGLKLAHPIVPSASPLSTSLDGIKRLEDGGAPAVVMYSLFEEQIERDLQLLHYHQDVHEDSHFEALSYFPTTTQYGVEADQYVGLLEQAVKATNIPIIGSLNGVTTGGWVKYARAMQDAGAAAIEVNVYYLPTDPHMTGAQVEQRYLEILAEVKRVVTVPVAMKLNPFFSAPMNMAQRLAVAGAAGLVLFNRFYQPDIDLDLLEVSHRLRLSTSDELRMPLRWVSIMHGRVPCDLAVTGGVHTHEDVLKALLAGANVAFMASALLHHGPGHIANTAAALREWLEEHEYDSVAQMIGSMSQRNVRNPDAYVRANYMRMLDSWKSTALPE